MSSISLDKIIVQIIKIRNFREIFDFWFISEANVPKGTKVYRYLYFRNSISTQQ